MKGESRGLPEKKCNDGGIQQEGAFHVLEIQVACHIRLFSTILIQCIISLRYDAYGFI